MKSMAEVFNDYRELRIDWIRENLGLRVGIKELENLLDQSPWVTKISDGIYSFVNETAKENYAEEPSPDYPTEDIVNTEQNSLLFDKETFEKVLLQRYRNGIQMDSIDLEIFRDTYSEMTGEVIDASDDELEELLRKSGIVYKDRVFPAEGIISNDIAG